MDAAGDAGGSGDDGRLGRGSGHSPRSNFPDAADDGRSPSREHPSEVLPAPAPAPAAAIDDHALFAHGSHWTGEPLLSGPVDDLFGAAFLDFDAAEAPEVPWVAHTPPPTPLTVLRRHPTDGVGSHPSFPPPLHAADDAGTPWWPALEGASQAESGPRGRHGSGRLPGIPAAPWQMAGAALPPPHVSLGLGDASSVVGADFVAERAGWTGAREDAVTMATTHWPPAAPAEAVTTTEFPSLFHYYRLLDGTRRPPSRTPTTALTRPLRQHLEPQPELGHSQHMTPRDGSARLGEMSHALGGGIDPPLHSTDRALGQFLRDFEEARSDVPQWRKESDGHAGAPQLPLGVPPWQPVGIALWQLSALPSPPHGPPPLRVPPTEATRRPSEPLHGRSRGGLAAPDQRLRTTFQATPAPGAVATMLRWTSRSGDALPSTLMPARHLHDAQPLSVGVAERRGDSAAVSTSFTHAALPTAAADDPTGARYPECNKTMSRGYLQWHIAMWHRGTDEEHKCRMCGRLCKRLRDLKRHMYATHCDDLLHKCSWCKDSDVLFATLVKLRHHIDATHDEAKVCDICGKTLTTAVGMQSHRRRMH